MTAMVVPFKVDPVSTSYSGTDVKIEWNLPYSGGNSIPISSYDIQVKKSDGSLIHYLPNCDGTSVSVISNRYCLIAMTDITGTVFGLSYSDLI